MRLPISADFHISSSMSVAADVFVPFFFNSPPQLLLIDAPVGNALGEVKIIYSNEFERRARRIDMCALLISSFCTIISTLRRNALCRYERAAAVLQARTSLIGGTDFSPSDSVIFRAKCTVQNCTFMSNLAPFPSVDVNRTSDSSLPFRSSSQLQIYQQNLRRIINPSCLLKPDHSCRCCPASILPPFSRAVDALSKSFWMSPPLRPGSFFGLDFLMPVRLGRIIVDVGHSFQDALRLEVLHSLSDEWILLGLKPQVSRAGKGGYAQGIDIHLHAVMRFTYNVERGLRDIWRLQVHTD
jgi:hypothetical protein